MLRLSFKYFFVKKKTLQTWIFHMKRRPDVTNLGIFLQKIMEKHHSCARLRRERSSNFALVTSQFEVNTEFSESSLESELEAQIRSFWRVSSHLRTPRTPCNTARDPCNYGGDLDKQVAEVNRR